MIDKQHETSAQKLLAHRFGFLFRYHFGPLQYEESLENAFPNISFSAFDPTIDDAREMNYRALMMTIFLQTFVNSKEYQLKSRFDPSQKIDERFVELLLEVKTQ